MARPYQHLGAEERAVIQIARRDGSTLHSVARLLNRHVSTVSRELAPNEVQVATDVRVRYDAKTAGMAYRMRRARSVRPCKLLEDGWLHEHVRDRLIFDRWSPQQIAARLRTMHPNDPARQVSAAAQPRASARPEHGRRAQAIAIHGRSRRTVGGDLVEAREVLRQAIRVVGI